MKKTALTIGLFSLVMVATSFAAPQTITASTGVSVSADTDGDGATGGIKKKRDAADFMDSKQSNFSNVSQSLGGNKKID